MYNFTSLSCFYFECFSQFSGIDMRTVEPDRHFRGLFYLLCHYVGSNMHDCGDTHDSTDTRVSGDMRFSGDTRSVLKRVSRRWDTPTQPDSLPRIDTCVSVFPLPVWLFKVKHVSL